MNTTVLKMRTKIACALALLMTAGAATALPKVHPTNVTLQTLPARIPASMPDDNGDLVTLDAEVIIPVLSYPCPGILWNHGFGGSKGNDRSEREAIARYGYVILSYTSRGFGDAPGETTGQVDLMGAKEQQDLLDAVDWLISPDNDVVQGAVIPDSIGQIGASYGGFHAWWLARSYHPAVKTVVVIATATDLYEALMPYDVEELLWPTGFYATGYRPEDENYSQDFHRIVLEMDTGLNCQDARTELMDRAVKRRWANIHVPVFIIQGINDSLFPANQAMEAYQELSARGVETRLYLGGIGHPPAVGDGPEIERLYDEALQWFDKHLKGKKDSDVPLISQSSIEVADTQYFNNVWDGTVRRANVLAAPGRTFYLCATSALGGTLSSAPCPGALPILMTNTAAGSGLAHEPVTSGLLGDEGIQIADTSQLPTVVTFETAPMAADAALDLAGIPRFDLQVSSTCQLPVGAQGALAAFQLDPKIWDVDPGGNATLITRGAFSEQVDATSLGTLPLHQVSFDIFATFYRFQAGHRLRITLATEDVPYLRPTTHPFVVTIHPGSAVTLATGEWLSEREQVRPSPEEEALTQRSVVTGLTLVDDLLQGLFMW